MTDPNTSTPGITEAQEAAEQLGALSRRIVDGQVATSERDELLRDLYRQDRKRYSQTWLASHAGLTQATISRILGKEDPDQLTAIHAPDILGCYLGAVRWVNDQLRESHQNYGGRAWKFVEHHWELDHIPAGIIGQATPLVDDDIRKLHAKVSPRLAAVARDLHQDIERRWLAAGQVGIPGRLTIDQQLHVHLAIAKQRNALRAIQDEHWATWRAEKAANEEVQEEK